MGSESRPVRMRARRGHRAACAKTGCTAVVYVEATTRLITISPCIVWGANKPWSSIHCTDATAASPSKVRKISPVCTRAAGFSLPLA